ncbi:DUF4384 domain-containing protein [Tahibacter amnicola]|uniref:DUF4384 domain-containing protein n=1 Tax=Tahibacter amnicola TaxID=2976241 RepID=A0ABY6B9N8_9GAMM|nr:DUF4384 domain-containing protein [Tahibacter amnicola]UXI66569.1 DUF4384 domain-containing protein [Tahibacter amnicola]
MKGRVVGLIAAVAVLGGCVAADPRRDVPFFERVGVEDRPVVQAERSISGFTDSLACMDGLLRESHRGTTIITSKNIPDASGKVYVATKEMIVTALSAMSRTSEAFRFVDFEVDPLRQDTVQTLSSMLIGAGQLDVPKPQLYVSGAISYMDQNVLVRRRGIGVAGANYEYGYSRDLIGTAFGMELHLGDFNTRTLLTGVDAANEIVLANQGSGMDLGGRIRKNGVQFNIGNDVSQGVGPAVRTLVELGLVELVGKWAKLPYWQCLSLDQAHPEFQRQLHDWYRAMDIDARLAFFRKALHGRGYLAGGDSTHYDTALRDAIQRFQADHDLVPSGDLGFQTYAELAKNYVRTDGQGHFTAVGLDNAVIDEEGRLDPALAGQPRNGAQPLDTLSPAAIAVKLSLPRADPNFLVGETLQLGISVDRSSWVYCYYRDVANTVAQIYPNPRQLEQPLHARRLVRVPDPADPQSFVIELTKAGQEAVLCVASDRDVTASLPEPLRAAPLTPLPSWTLEKISQSFDALVIPGLGRQMIEWKVQKKR